ncbi:MAG: N-6 DNA methylase [Actinobacteria bacterium]|nr:N-6 DNA methylase [Actinomycetota bacterium]
MVIHRATENTITSCLKEELEKRGIKAEPFASITTPVGRREVDLLCSNGGYYVIEAKFTERELIRAIAKIQNDYLKFHKLLNIKGGFSIIYPEKLTEPMEIGTLESIIHKLKFKIVLIFPPEDNRPFTVEEGTLDKIADIITTHVLNPPQYIEPSIEYMIRSLREAALALTNGMKELSGSQLEGIFGGKNVFKNILQYEETEYPIEDLRVAAAYLVVNQLLFYHVLARTKPDVFPEIDTNQISTPIDLKRYFEKAMQFDYKTIFSYDVVSVIPPKFKNLLVEIVNLINALSPEKIKGDLLGTIFHDLVPFEIRKSVAAFYTNILAAELLAHLAIDSYKDTIADFACGSGGLLVAAYKRKKELLEKEREFTENDHKKFVEEDILGVDVMPFAANIAACHLALQSPEYFTNKVQIAVWDATELRPSQQIPPVAGIRMISGQKSLDEFIKIKSSKKEDIKGVVALNHNQPEKIELKQYDVVIMNPPFTRHERIPEDYKEVLSERFKEYNNYLHGQLSYHGYFILLADRFLKENGRMALVIPATVLRVRSFHGIRELLAEKYHIEYIVTTHCRSAFSESTRFREILLVARKAAPRRDSLTKIVTLKKLPQTLQEVKAISEQIKTLSNNYEDEKLMLEIIDSSELRSNVENWFQHISFSTEDIIESLFELFSSNNFVALGDVLEEHKIIRGIETKDSIRVQLLTISRNEQRALKRDDEWIVENIESHSIVARNRHTQVRVEIPLSSLKPALRRISNIHKIDITSELDFVIVRSFPEEQIYLENSLHPTRVDWVAWKKYVDNRLGKLSIARRFDISAPGTCLLAFYSEIPYAPPGVAWTILTSSDELAKLLCLWFNSTLSILQFLRNRKETRGAFMQVDKYILTDLKIPDFDTLGEENKQRLLDLFEQIKDVEFPSILEQLKMKFPSRVLIDKAWLQALGHDNEETEEIINELYNLLVQEIDTLKELMQEQR